MVVLYNRAGDSLSFSTLEWQELLTCATRYGWKPRGTGAPPSTWDLSRPPSERTPWDGNYSIPAGQTVSPEDASELAGAIERALETETGWNRDDEATLRGFTSFCRQRGFLVSATRFVPRSAAPRLIAFPKRPVRTPLHLAS